MGNFRFNVCNYKRNWWYVPLAVPPGQRHSMKSDCHMGCARIVALACLYAHGGKLAVFGIEYALAVLNKEATPADRETPVALVVATPETARAVSP